MSARILRARLVVPVSEPPIDNGAVAIDENRITAVGPWSQIGHTTTDPVEDLGEVALLPGLINAHCHLDYTNMAGMISPQRRFPDWIKAIIAIKASWSYTEFASSWVAGAQMLERSGVTSVVDIEAVPELIPEVWQATPLRVWSCLELINLRSQSNAQQLVSRALSQARENEQNETNRHGLSPHALYTTTKTLRQSARQRAASEKRLLTTHIAESRDEWEMFQSATGDLYNWLNPQRASEDRERGSPVAVLDREGYFNHPVIAAHVNELGEGDAERLAKGNATVVHCPRSHRYFGHRSFPWAQLESAGVNLTLGTDSLASVRATRNESPSLDFFAEMSCLANQKSAPQPDKILTWATRNGAIAIDHASDLGLLRANYLADLIAIPYVGDARSVCESIVFHQGPVSASIINGQSVPAHKASITTA